MEAKLPSMDILLQIERQILYRIELLSQKQNRLLTNKLVLRKHRELKRSLLSQNKQAENSIKEDKPLPNEFGDLDGILNLAKEIRAGVTKTGKQSDKTRTETRQTLRDAVSLAKKTDVNPDTDDVTRDPSREEQLLNDLHEQLLFLTRNRIALHVAKLYMNRSKFSHESKFLSKLLAYPTQPRSTIFRTIYPTLPISAPESPIAPPLTPFVKDSVVVRLAQQFKNLVVQYDRHMRQRINHESYKLSQLSADEKRAMVTLWMRGRKLMELYQHYVKTKQKLVCTCEACSLVRRNRNAQSGTAIATLNHATPSYTPLPSPSATTEQEHPCVPGGKNKAKAKGSTGSSHNVWVSASKTRVEAFHDAYQSKVLLIAESAVGQEQLKGTIQALKSCCEDSATRTKLGENNNRRLESDSGFVSKWVESLKQFRLVYSILLNEAQELNHCIFINKT